MFSLKFLAAAAALFITAQGAPANGLEERKLINDCGDSTFVDETSDASPLISDCEIIVSNIQNGGSWTTGDGGYWRQLVQFGTCALGVQGDFQAQVFYVGNEDIMNVCANQTKLLQTTNSR